MNGAYIAHQGVMNQSLEKPAIWMGHKTGGLDPHESLAKVKPLAYEIIMVIQGTHWWFIEPIDDDFGDDLWKSICHINLW